MAGQFQPSPNIGASNDVLSNFGSGTFGGSYKPSVASSGTSLPVKGASLPYDYGVYRRVGDSCEILYNYEQRTPGTAGMSIYLFALPSGVVLDTTKMPINNNVYEAQGLVGYASTQNLTSGVVSWGNVGFWSTTQLVMFVGSTAQAPIEVGQGFHNFGLTQIRYSFTARFPVVGWSSTDS